MTRQERAKAGAGEALAIGEDMDAPTTTDRAQGLQKSENGASEILGMSETEIQGGLDAAPGAQEAPVRVGRVTTIQRPYQGTKPVQAQKSAVIVRVDGDSVRTAQNRIDGARGLAQTSFGGSGFKTVLMKSLQETFRPAKGVAVDGVTFDGTPYLVDINKAVPGKVVSDPHLTAEKLALLDILPEIVQRGEYVGSGEYV